MAGTGFDGGDGGSQQLSPRLSRGSCSGAKDQPLGGEASAAPFELRVWPARAAAAVPIAAPLWRDVGAAYLH